MGYWNERFGKAFEYLMKNESIKLGFMYFILVFLGAIIINYFFDSPILFFAWVFLSFIIILIFMDWYYWRKEKGGKA